MSYLKPLIKEYRHSANPENAISMAKYMKNLFPFYGIPSPARKEIEREFIKKSGKPDISQLPEIIKSGINHPEREVHYFVVDITSKLVKKADETFVTTTKWMITNKSWWDTVDAIAVNIVGPLVTAHPKLIKTMDQWIKHENMWLQRTAILHQLKYKSKTNPERLFEYCSMCKDSNEFFIKKAIGWALREYSKTDPALVMEFVQKTNLKPFSKKEALKWVEKNKSHRLAK